jgi:hypothetical protein
MKRKLVAAVPGFAAWFVVARREISRTPAIRGYEGRTDGKTAS